MLETWQAEFRKLENECERNSPLGTHPSTSFSLENYLPSVSVVGAFFYGVFQDSRKCAIEWSLWYPHIFRLLTGCVNFLKIDINFQQEFYLIRSDSLRNFGDVSEKIFGRLAKCHLDVWVCRMSSHYSRAIEKNQGFSESIYSIHSLILPVTWYRLVGSVARTSCSRCQLTGVMLWAVLQNSGTRNVDYSLLLGRMKSKWFANQRVNQMCIGKSKYSRHKDVFFLVFGRLLIDMIHYQLFWGFHVYEEGRERSQTWEPEVQVRSRPMEAVNSVREMILLRPKVRLPGKMRNLVCIGMEAWDLPPFWDKMWIVLFHNGMHCAVLVSRDRNPIFTTYIN